MHAKETKPTDAIGLGTAQAIIGCSRGAVYIWALSGRLKAKKVDGRYLTTRREAERVRDEYLAVQRVGRQPHAA